MVLKMLGDQPRQTLTTHDESYHIMSLINLNPQLENRKINILLVETFGKVEKKVLYEPKTVACAKLL